MLRLSLDEVILQILALDLGDPYEFLAAAVSPPDITSIRNAILFLDSLSAIRVGDEDIDVGVETRNKDSKYDYENDDVIEGVQITPLGYHLATLPVNPKIGKLILYGTLLCCIDPILTIAAALSSKSPFESSFENRNLADEAKISFLDHNSDLLTMLKAYDSWRLCVTNARIAAKSGNINDELGYVRKMEEEFCNQKYLSLNSLQVSYEMKFILKSSSEILFRI